MIRQRQKDNDAAHNERIDHIWQRKLQERDTVLQKIQKKKMKALRKLAAKRTKVENKIEKRDIIADYANYASNVYAPRARDGPSYDKSNFNLQGNFQQFDDYNGNFGVLFLGLLQLENTFPISVLEASVDIPITKTKGNDLKNRKVQRAHFLINRNFSYSRNLNLWTIILKIVN